MKRLSEMVAVSAVALCLVSSPVRADHPVEVTMLVESYDGCGCLDPFADPVSCAACPAGVSTGFPDCDVLGDRSLDHHWKNSGWTADMLGNSSQPEQGWATQDFAIGDVNGDRSHTLACDAFGAGAAIWIDYDNLESPGCGTTSAQRFEMEQARVARGLPVPDTTLPAHFVIAVRRDDLAGTGDTSDITTRIWMDLDGMPSGFTDSPVTTDVLPGTGWQDVIVNNLPRYVTRGRLHLLVNLGPQGAFADCAAGEKVTVRIDNLRYVYTGLVPDIETNCADGIDDDWDGLTDCDDTADCNGNAACPCNQFVLFDTDFDDDVDQVDFAFFQSCVTGPGPNNPQFEALSAECKCLDATGPGGQTDQAIDQADLAGFERCASGPMVPADLACDD